MSEINTPSTYTLCVCEKERESPRSLVLKDRTSWTVPFLVGSSRVKVPLGPDGKISLTTGQRVTCLGGFTPQYCEYRDRCDKTPRVESQIFGFQFRRAETPFTGTRGDDLTLIVKP